VNLYQINGPIPLLFYASNWQSKLLEYLGELIVKHVKKDYLKRSKENGTWRLEVLEREKDPITLNILMYLKQ
jgi:hypothetical protein